MGAAAVARPRGAPGSHRALCHFLLAFTAKGGFFEIIRGYCLQEKEEETRAGGREPPRLLSGAAGKASASHPARQACAGQAFGTFLVAVQCRRVRVAQKKYTASA